MKKFLCLVGLLLALIQPCFSASTIIENYTPEELKSTLVKLYVKEGANIKNTNDYQLVVDKKGSFWEDVFFGSNFNSYITIRITYNFAKDGNNTIVNVNAARITNPNSAYEYATPLSDAILQPELTNIQKALNGYIGYGFTWKKQKGYIIVMDKSADIELSFGDKIYKINDSPVKKLSKSTITQVLTSSKEGQELKLNLLHYEQDKEVILKSRFIEPTITKENL